MSTAHHDQLREAAAGHYPRMAATELLIRAFDGRFAAVGNPWVTLDGVFRKYWIDFEQIPANIAALSGGQRRLLMLAASIANVGVEVDMGELLSGLEHGSMELVLAAAAYAGNGDAHFGVEENADGTVSLKRLPPLFPWPDGE